MIGNIIKKDLKRKRTMNFILLLFVVLASMFVASGLNNVLTIAKGTDYYMEQAGLPEYSLLTVGENAVGTVDPYLENEPLVKGFEKERVLYMDGTNLKAKGKELQHDGTIVFQPMEDTKIRFFDANNEVVDSVLPGKVYFTSGIMKECELEVGEKITLLADGIEKEFEIAGRLKDCFLGANLIGNVRMLVNEQDFAQYWNSDFLRTYYAGEVIYIHTDSPKEMPTVLANAPNVAFGADPDLIHMAYVTNLVVAGIILVVSICLILVSFVVLRFTIRFTMQEEFREIGVMKAIGIRNFKIRSLYIVKYLFLSACGSAIGFGASIPFGRMLIASVGENMVLGNDEGVLINALGAALVVAATILFAYLCTARIKKATPTDAIRDGQTGERFRKKSGIRLAGSHSGNAFFMACNDILSAPRRYLSILLTFTICTLLTLLIVNATATLQGDELSGLFGRRSHIYSDNVGLDMSVLSTGGRERLDNKLDELDAIFAGHGIESNTAVELQYRLKVSSKTHSGKSTIQIGYRVGMEEYEYLEGTAPKNLYEIAITDRIAQMYDLKIGDRVSIDLNGEEIDCLVTAKFQTMNQVGELIRMHPALLDKLDMSFVKSMFCFETVFADKPSPEQISERCQILQKEGNVNEVLTAGEYVAKCTGVADTLNSVKLLLLVITVLVVILVTILMERSFVSEEKSQIALLKALGFRERTIRFWQMYRFLLVGVFAVICASLLSFVITPLAFDPIFGMMGTSSVTYHYDLVQLFCVYPGVVLAVTIAAAVMTSLYTRSIHSYDTASIE